jgi:hypothetical protein
VVINGCAPKRVHKTIEVKEKKVVHQPLVQLEPIKPPVADVTSKTVEYYKTPKAKMASSNSGSVARPKPAKPTASTIAVAAVALPKPDLGSIDISIIKADVKARYQARLEPGWEAKALKYLSIDGLEYSLNEILAYSKRSGSSSPFLLHESGILLISLEEAFKLELAFYPPKTAGHEEFKEFNLHVYNKKGNVVHKEFVNKRMQIYTIEK